MKIWLDDIREPPDDTWTWCKTVIEAGFCLVGRDVTDMSLDHDLGLDEYGELAPDGYHLVKWMAAEDLWPINKPTIHSSNPVGRKNMQAIIDRYGPYGGVK